MSLSHAAKIKAMFDKNPNVKASVVADTLGVTPAYVYSIKKQMKQGIEVTSRKAGRPKKVKNEGEFDIETWLKTGKTVAPAATARFEIQTFPTTHSLWEKVSGFFSSNTSFKDMVNSPAHYKTGGIETIDFIRAKELGFNLGNAVKYISRAGKKNPALFKQDIEKAIWYLNEELQSR